MKSVSLWKTCTAVCLNIYVHFTGLASSKSTWSSTKAKKKSRIIKVMLTVMTPKKKRKSLWRGGPIWKGARVRAVMVTTVMIVRVAMRAILMTRRVKKHPDSLRRHQRLLYSRLCPKNLQAPHLIPKRFHPVLQGLP